MMFRQAILFSALFILAAPALADEQSETKGDQNAGPIKVIPAPVQTVPKFGSRTDSSPKFGASTGSSPKFGAATDRNSVAFTKDDFPKSDKNVVAPPGHVIVIHKGGFRDIDKDRSDTIDLQEFEAFSGYQGDKTAKTFSELDKNEDQVLSPDEFKNN